MEQVPGQDSRARVTPARHRKYVADEYARRHFITGTELTREELLALIERRSELKSRDRGGSADRCGGRAVALLFERPSTRTRVSFHVGIPQLGGEALCSAATSFSSRAASRCGTRRWCCPATWTRSSPGVADHESDRAARDARPGAGRERAHSASPSLPGARRPADAEGALRQARADCGSPTSATATTSATR